MKTALILLLLVIGSVSLNATIITVDNKFPSAGKFTNLQDAHDYAIDGDTIYVYPSQNAYEAIIVSKKLTIIGTGWESPGDGLPFTMITGTMRFVTGADGSKLMGFYINGEILIGHSGSNYSPVSGVVIMKNKFYTAPSIINIVVYRNCKDIIIMQNWLNGSDVYQYTIGVIMFDIYTSILIRNNIIGGERIINSLNLADVLETTIILKNNVFRYGRLYLKKSDFEVENNIFMLQGVSHTTNSPFKIRNNLSKYNVLPDGYGNIENVDLNDVFVDAVHGDFHLKPGSPAIGSGVNGVDMGIYGGSTPFVDGGYPGIPSIIQFEADATGSRQDGLNVKIKAKSNKD